MSSPIPSEDEIRKYFENEELFSLINSLFLLGTITDLDKLLEKFVEIIVENFKAERGLLFLEYEGELTPKVVKTIEPVDLSNMAKVANFIIKELINEKDFFFSQNFEEEYRRDKNGFPLKNVLSIMCASLIFNEKRMGVLYIDRGKKSSPFSEKDQIHLNLFVKLVSPFIYYLKEKEEGKIVDIIGHSSESFASRDYPEIITNSSNMLSIFETLDLVAPSNVSVLILGESGTGKELIARAIHYKSKRRNKRFIIQNCASIPETLLESELFGYKKGAFTGAVSDKPGLFEVADGGTLFLDEVGDLSLSSQAKILRAIQEGEIKRIGDNTSRKVDVRIISATNKDLQEQIYKGLFREDLYYRLNIVTIRVPPLRERKEDIPLLSNHFLESYCKKLGKRFAGIDPSAIEILTQYSWPGNVRQLKNEMERIAILLQDGELVTPDKISEVVHKSVLIEPKSEGKKMKDVLTSIQIKMILDSLSKHKWNKKKAAEELGISTRGLLKMIDRFELDRRKKKR